MSKNSRSLFIPSAYSVWTAPVGTTAPTSASAAPSAGWYEIGYLSDQGIGEGRNVNESKIYDLVGQLLAIARNQEERPFTFEALEDNPAVRSLRYPSSVFTTTGGTSEVQTITLTGTGTAGTWSITLPGYGTAAALTYNVTTSALATALNAAFSITGITVSGTPGTSYVVTFPAVQGNVPTMTTTNAITGISGITVAETTPGVSPVNKRSVGSGTGRNLRAWLVYMSSGNVHKLFSIGNGEVTQSGTVTATGAAAAVSSFELQPFPDSNGNFFDLIDDDASQTATFA